MQAHELGKRGFDTSAFVFFEQVSVGRLIFFSFCSNLGFELLADVPPPKPTDVFPTKPCDGIVNVCDVCLRRIQDDHPFGKTVTVPARIEPGTFSCSKLWDFRGSRTST